jgi:hypothetical protein
MSLAFRSAGSKSTAVFAADSDPNAIAPLVARIVELPERAENGRVARDARFYPIFTTVTGTPAIDVVPWVRDDLGNKWVDLPKLTGLEDTDFVVLEGVAPGRLFFQITALAGGTIASVEIRVAAL